MCSALSKEKMKKKRRNININSRISRLETLEEKSFWTIAPAIAITGLLALCTTGLYSTGLPPIMAATMCFVAPCCLMIFVYFRGNYHYAYPLLCIAIGGIAVPITFVFNGGYMSGMPLFCLAITSVCALCYRRTMRWISLGACFLGNAIAFIYVHRLGAPYALGTEENVFKDVFFSYYLTSLAIFVAISLITNEISKYRLSQEVLQKYFDEGVRKEIMKSAATNKDIESETRKAVILFADISRFTTATEKMDPKMAAEFLNEFFAIAEKKIHDTNGIIDKYIGDCVMAYWFEDKNGNCVLNSIMSVIAMKKELYMKSEKIFEKYGTELNFSAGIAYGDVIFGNIGTDDVHNYTIIGDAVNTASRIENYASGGEMLISDSAASMVQGLAVLERVETDVYFKGKSESVNLYRVIGLDVKADEKVAKPNLNGYNLYICGCRGSFPVSGLRFSEYGGETSCYVLKKNKYAIIIDCGTGLKNTGDILKDCERVDILLTHVHYDHILGLLSFKLPENIEAKMYGNFGKWSSNPTTLSNFMDHPYWPIGINQIENVDIKIGEEIVLGEDIKATFYESDHPDDACVIKLMCGQKKLCIYADCEDPNKLDPEISADCDLLLFDGMYDDDDKVDHTGWGHGTWQAGLKFAQKQNIKALMITHHNPELGDHTLLEKEQKARTVLRNVTFAKTGDCVQI